MTILASQCTAVAAQYYHIPATAIERVQAHAGAGGGMGPMGIQPGWLPILVRIGFPAEAVKHDACVNIAAGAWILAWAGAGRAPGAPRAPQPVPAPPAAPLSSDLSTCATQAAQHYRLPEVLYRAILLTEGGSVGRVSRNQNGTYDIGPAQVNSSHLAELARVGISRDRLVNDGCLNIHVGAWILARELDGHTPDDPAEFWRRVGNYNSRTPEFNKAYQRKVWLNARIASQSQTHPPS